MAKTEAALAKRIALPSKVGQAIGKEVFGEPYVVFPWLAYAEQRIVDAVMDTSHERYIILNCPPQVGKSTYVGILLPFWLTGMFPHWQIMYISYSDDFSTGRGKDVRSLHQIYGKELFNSSIDPDFAAATDWRVTGGRGGMLSVGIGGLITGRPGHVIIVDDLIKNAVEAASVATKKMHVSEWDGTINRRMQPGGTVIIVATRWAEDDLSGVLIDRMSEPGYEGPAWEVIDYPAFAEPPDDSEMSDDELLEWRDSTGRKLGEVLDCRFSRIPGRTPEDFFTKVKAGMDGFTFCTPAETPILMADRTEKPISEVQPGDMVLGYTKGTMENRMKLVPTKVLATNGLHRPVCDYVMESGHTVRATRDHRWYTGRFGGVERAKNGREFHRPMYAAIAKGGRLMRMDSVLPELTPRRQRLLDWLAGMIDGEGHCALSAIHIAQSPDANADVFDKLQQTLDELDYSYKLTITKPDDGFATAHRSGVFVLRSPRLVYSELIRRTDIAKRDRILSVLAIRNSMPIVDRDKILDVIEGPAEPVYALETETGNYIAWGYASSNSNLYMQRPSAREGGMFPVENWQFYDPNDMPSIDKEVRVWDMAATEGGGDWTCGVKVGRSGDKFYVIDMRRFRKNAGGVQHDVEMVAALDGYGVKIKLEEEKGGSGKSVIEAFKRLLVGYTVESAKAEGDKESRCRPYAAVQNTRRMFLPTPGSVSWDIKGFINEHKKMMGDGRRPRHDDQIDVTAYAMLELLGSGVVEIWTPSGGNFPSPERMMASLMGRSPFDR